MKKLALQLGPPVIFVLVAAALWVAPGTFSGTLSWTETPRVAQGLELLSFFFLGASALLASTMNQSRIFYAAIHLVSASLWLRFLPTVQRFSLPAVHLVSALALGFFANLLILFAQRDFRVTGRQSFLNLVLSIGLPLIAAQSFKMQFAPLMRLTTWHELPPNSLWILPDALAVIFAFVVLLLFLKNEKGGTIFKTHLGLTILLVAIGFNAWPIRLGDGTGAGGSIAFSLAGFSFFFLVSRIYWEKAYLDELTGVLNRRAFNEDMMKVKRPYSIAMVDVDHFKSFNDRFGHDQGDHVLRLVATHLHATLEGKVYRYGGEEFAVILPKLKAAAAWETLESARRSLDHRPFVLRSSVTTRKRRSKRDRTEAKPEAKKERATVHITVSMGVADARKSTRSPEQVLQKADAALYEAKALGRNRVIVHASAFQPDR